MADGRNALPGQQGRGSGDASQIRFASTLASSQALDRASAGRLPDEDGRAGEAGPAGPVFLELPTKSYAAGATEEQREIARQQAMLETSRRFLAPGPEREEEVPAPSERPRATGAGAGPAEEEGVPQEARRVRAQVVLQQAQQLARREEEEEAVRQALSGAEALNQFRQQAVRVSKRVRNVMKAVQTAGAMSLVTIVTLVIQVNLELINKWITKIKIPFIMEPEPEPSPGLDDIFACCVNGIVGTACLVTLAQGIFVIMIIAIITKASTGLIIPLVHFFQSLF